MSEKNYYRVTVKTAYEAANGKMKAKKDNYIVIGITPTDVEKKMVDHLSMSDFEIVNINLLNIVEVVS